MNSVRIIPRLDIKGENVIKGVHLECLRVVGDPKEMAARYYREGADELLYMDTVASLYGRNNLLPIIEKASQDIFIPLTVGGGIRSIEDIRMILRAGADKVAINTYAVQHPEFITEAARVFGSQCIVGSIEAQKTRENKWEAFTDNGRERTGLDAIVWAKRLEELGAGELLVTSIDQEGTEKGYDTELIAAIAPAVNIPVIAAGGAGNPSHVADVVRKGRADAVSCAHIFHYNKHSIKEVKEALRKEGFKIRL
ncbi:MAG: imidazole glycerol phosphate synthase subunit HisF [Patescibacteria group bacterium]|nr:imidazole glycerol phosphate synthase subunit HisF [Patescibacteria group bacterium]